MPPESQFIPDFDQDLVDAFEKVRKARKRLIERRTKKSYTKLDCVAREGCHSAETVHNLPYKDE